MSVARAAFQRILVPVDFSLRSANALEFAVALGSRSGSVIDVLHVWHSDLATPVTVARERAKSELRQFVAGLELRGNVELRRRTDHGDAYLTIQRTAQLAGYDLIVVAGPESNRAEADTVARRLLGTASSPVLFVPAHCQARLRSDEERVLKLERILVPLSLAGALEEAVAQAQALRSADDATIELSAVDESTEATVQRFDSSRFDLVVMCGQRARLGERPDDTRALRLAASVPCPSLSLPG